MCIDAAIAVGLLVVQEIIPAYAIAHLAFVAELGLDGTLRNVAGIVPLVASITDRAVVVSRQCEHEARIAADFAEAMAKVEARLIETGLEKGQSVAILGTSCIDYALVFLGAVRAGGVAAPLTTSASRAVPAASMSAAVLIPKVAEEQATFMSNARPLAPR